MQLQYKKPKQKEPRVDTKNWKDAIVKVKNKK